MRQCAVVVRSAVVIAALGMVRPAIAQSGVTWAMDASVGPTYGVGGDFVNRSNPFAEIALSVRRDTKRGFGIDAEFAYDWSATIGGDALCAVSPSGTGCLPDFPAFSGGLGLVGLTLGSPSAVQLRLNAGMAVYGVHDTRLGAPVTAMDVAVAPSSWLAFVAGMRAFVLPNYLGDRLMVTTWRLGVRLQSVQ